MKEVKTLSRKAAEKKWIYWSIPALFIIACLMHFVYEWLGKNIIVAIFAPTNESIWEHLKMTFWPVLLWWFIWYFINRKKYNIDSDRWVVSAVVALLVCPLVIMAFYYTYTEALGIESIVLDIFSVLLAVTIAQLLALHIYHFAKPYEFIRYGAIVILIALIIAFTLFTFNPPHLPLFLDTGTGTYGI